MFNLMGKKIITILHEKKCLSATMRYMNQRCRSANSMHLLFQKKEMCTCLANNSEDQLTHPHKLIRASFYLLNGMYRIKTCSKRNFTIVASL